MVAKAQNLAMLTWHLPCREKRPLNFRVISDAEALVEALGAERFPSHYFINPTGSIEKFEFPLGITFTGKSREEVKAKRKAAKKEWNNIMVE